MKKATKRVIWAGVNLLAGIMSLALYLWFMSKFGPTFDWLSRYSFAKWPYIGILALDAALFGVQFIKKDAADVRKTAEKLLFALLAALFIVTVVFTWRAAYPQYVGDTRDTMFYPPLAIKGWVVGAAFACAAVIRCFFNTKPARKAFGTAALVAAAALFVFMGAFYATNKELMDLLEILIAGWKSYVAVAGIAVVQSLPHVLRLIALGKMVK